VNHAANVLLVEDNPGDARLIQEMLAESSQDQFRLWRKADRLSSGLDFLDQGDIGMVLLDLSLPDSLGLDTFSSVFARAPQVPIIVLTGTDDEILALSAVKTGAQDYLVKGHVDSNLLQRAMRYALERKQAERALRASEERYALAAAGSNDGLWDWHLLQRQVYFSPRWKAMLGCAEQDVGATEDEWLQRIHGEDLPEFRERLGRCVAGQTDHLVAEYRMLHKDGSHRWMLCRGIAVRDAHGMTWRLAGSQTDINERKLAAQQLLHDALHDSLTGLPNRALLMESLRRALDRAQRHPEHMFAVLFIDLDRFKNVNDSLGHMVGDRFLIECGRRLALCCRPEDTLARLGGDEFILLLDDISGESDAIRVAERVQADLEKSLIIEGNVLSMSGSIGVAISSPHYTHPEELLRDADTAMYRAKAQGKACYSLFDAAMHARAVAELKMEADLRRAVEQQGFHLDYQPVIALGSGQLVGFEALIRWHHPELGPVSPAAFIPMAEETGLIVAIGQWVLSTACEQLASWRSLGSGLGHVTISVNLSSRQLFGNNDLVAQVADTLRRTGLPAANLKLEITESILMADVTAASEKLRQLKGIGVRISMDDFGTGYSSLSYLHRFPVDTLKIDQSFIRNMGKSVEAVAIVRAILSLAQSLKMDVIAEGPETADEVQLLRSMDCPHVQGHYFSRPLSVQAAAEALRQVDPVWRGKLFAAAGREE